MNALPQRQMTVEEFLAWSEGQPGRYELYAGQVYAMSPERAEHAEVKFAVQTELKRAIDTAGVPCRMLPDGMTVRVAKDTAHEPDALVYCGPRLPKGTIELPNPVIVIEVLSPSTRHIDASAKLAGYFQLESIEHYIIVDPERRPTIHHRKLPDGSISTRLVKSGTIRLDPPGIDIDTSAFFPV